MEENRKLQLVENIKIHYGVFKTTKISLDLIEEVQNECGDQIDVNVNLRLTNSKFRYHDNNIEIDKNDAKQIIEFLQKAYDLGGNKK